MSSSPDTLAGALGGKQLGTFAGLRASWLGRLEFVRALALQDAIVANHARIGDSLLLLEHDPVYTTGRVGRPENLPRDAHALGIPIFRVGRGGDATYHGPGQLVGYPLIDLRARGGDVHLYLRALEAGLSATLRALGVKAGRSPGRTGVWTGDGHQLRKIASIGIGVRRGITMHGFALNLTVDLAPFAAIVPCALRDVEMTSVAAEVGREWPPIEAVATLAARHVALALAEPGVVADNALRVDP